MSALSDYLDRERERIDAYRQFVNAMEDIYDLADDAGQIEETLRRELQSLKARLGRTRS